MAEILPEVATQIALRAHCPQPPPVTHHADSADRTETVAPGIMMGCGNTTHLEPMACHLQRLVRLTPTQARAHSCKTVLHHDHSK